MLEIDLSLLEGHEFRCRPDCGLCCFASPAVTRTESARLLQILPAAGDAVRSGHILARSHGGACRLLEASRCTGHAARPFACRSFPLTVHLGPRAQVTAVLSCPGVDTRSSREGEHSDPQGLDEELRAVREAIGEIAPPDVRRCRTRWSRALRDLGVPDPLARAARASVAALLADDPLVDPEDAELPSEEDGLEQLPLFKDEEFGVVAIARDAERVDLLQMREAGGVGQRLATLDANVRRPTLDGAALAALTDYRALLLARDGTIGSAAESALAVGVGELAGPLAADVRAALATALARAVWRERLRGRAGTVLDAAAVRAGIAATDADVLDRPTVGRWL